MRECASLPVVVGTTAGFSVGEVCVAVPVVMVVVSMAVVVETECPGVSSPLCAGGGVGLGRGWVGACLSVLELAVWWWVPGVSVWGPAGCVCCCCCRGCCG